MHGATIFLPQAQHFWYASLETKKRVFHFLPLADPDFVYEVCFTWFGSWCHFILLFLCPPSPVLSATSGPPCQSSPPPLPPSHSQERYVAGFQGVAEIQGTGVCGTSCRKEGGGIPPTMHRNIALDTCWESANAKNVTSLITFLHVSKPSSLPCLRNTTKWQRVCTPKSTPKGHQLSRNEPKH